jgi:hypothetical protein
VRSLAVLRKNSAELMLKLGIGVSPGTVRLSFARTGAALLWVTIANVSVANRPMIAMDSQP